MNAVQGQRGGANNSGNGADPRLHYPVPPVTLRAKNEDNLAAH